MKGMAATEAVAPRQNDMILPLMVIKVMPTATQPMNETVVSIDRTLGFEENPGVARATTMSAPSAVTRMAVSSARRSDPTIRTHSRAAVRPFPPTIAGPSGRP